MSPGIPTPSPIPSCVAESRPRVPVVGDGVPVVGDGASAVGDDVPAAVCGDPEVKDEVLLVTGAVPVVVEAAAEVNNMGLGVGLTGPVRMRPAGKMSQGKKRIEERASQLTRRTLGYIKRLCCGFVFRRTVLSYAKTGISVELCICAVTGQAISSVEHQEYAEICWDN